MKQLDRGASRHLICLNGNRPISEELEADIVEALRVRRALVFGVWVMFWHLYWCGVQAFYSDETSFM
jgi:hypothetical protein